jgi:hypothetical protein
MTNIIAPAGYEWLIPEFMEWYYDVHSSSNTNVQLLFDAWVAGYRHGFEPAY